MEHFIVFDILSTLSCEGPVLAGSVLNSENAHVHGCMCSRRHGHLYLHNAVEVQTRGTVCYNIVAIGAPAE